MCCRYKIKAVLGTRFSICDPRDQLIATKQRNIKLAAANKALCGSFKEDQHTQGESSLEAQNLDLT